MFDISLSSFDISCSVAGGTTSRSFPHPKLATAKVSPTRVERESVSVVGTTQRVRESCKREGEGGAAG